MSNDPSNSPSPSWNPGPSTFQGTDQAVLEALRKISDGVDLQSDLIRATNYLLMSQVQGSGPSASAATPGTSVFQQSTNNNSESSTTVVYQNAANTLSAPREPYQQPTRSSAPREPYQPVSSNPSADLDRIFDKHFGRESTYVDPQKGLGRYAARTAKQKWRTSRPRRWGKTAAKFAMGAGNTLGLPSGVNKVLGEVTAVIGKVVGGAVSLVEAFIKVRNAIDQFTEAQFAAAERIAQNSGDVQMVLAKREIEQIKRDIERGRRTSGSLDELQTSEAGRKREEMEIGIVVDNALNKIMTVANDLITPILGAFNSAMDIAEKIPGSIGDAVKELRQGAADGRSTFDDIGQASQVARNITNSAHSLMDAARRAGAGMSGSTAPSGAAPRGRLP